LDPAPARPAPDAEPRPPLDLPRWLWLGLPSAVFLLPYAAKAWSEDAFDRWVRSESGIVENLTALALAVAVGAGVGVLRRRRRLPGRWLGVWFALGTLGCVYFLGEELSWGQHLFGWSTPETLAAINEQGETNLHNIGGWTEGLLDQGPRALLTLGALVGGVVLPLVLARSRRRWDAAPAAAPWTAWAIPTWVALPSGLLAQVANLPKHVAAALGGELPAGLDVRGGESKECFLALFLMLYLLDARRRLGRVPDPAGPADRPA